MRKPPLQDVIVKPTRSPEPIRSARPRPYVEREEHVEDTRHTEYDPYGPVEGGYEQDDRRTPHHRGVHHDMPPRGMYARGPGIISRKWLFMALGIGAVVILSSVALSLLFAGATVTVYPKQDSVIVDTSFTAERNGADGALAYEPLIIERTAKRSVAAQGEEQVELRTEGTLTIYNEYSSTPQRLIKRTRFESESGRIYRIQNAVEVPGMKSDGTPGSVEVTVVAEEPGDAYDIKGPMEFNIPGFVGTPQEGKVYAKSVEDFVGGFSGVRRSVGEAERAQARDELEVQLKDELLAAALNGNEQPPEYYLSQDAVFFEFTTLPDELVEADKVTLSLTGRLHGILFDRDQFSARIARSTLASYDGEPLTIENLDELSLQVTPIVPEEEADGVAPWQVSSYTVEVQGKASFIWEFDADQLARDLAGMDKTILDAPYEGSILESYVGIDRLQAAIRPFWKSSFPSTEEDIVVITKLDE